MHRKTCFRPASVFCVRAICARSCRGIHQRTLAIHGERDQLTPIAAGTFTAAALPRAEMETIEGAAHAPFVTHAERLAQRIAHFVHG